MRYALDLLCMALIVAILATMAVALTGCTVNNPGKPSVSVSLPKAPQYYHACFAKLAPASQQGRPLTRAAVVSLIGKLNASNARYSKCGRDLLKWYATIRTAYAKAPSR